MRTEEAKKLILEGHIPDVTVKDPIDAILNKAMVMCLQLDPGERSSAKEVYVYLQNELDKLLKIDGNQLE